MIKKIIKPLGLTLISLFLLSLSFYFGMKYELRVIGTTKDIIAIPARNAAVAISTSTTPIELLTEADKQALNLTKRGRYQVISRNSSGQVIDYKYLGLNDLAPIALDIMTDAEKKEKGIPPNLKIQVLERDNQGKVSIYKVIKTDADILTQF